MGSRAQKADTFEHSGGFGFRHTLYFVLFIIAVDEFNEQQTIVIDSRFHAC
jgi:hypothetical protein